MADVGYVWDEDKIALVREKHNVEMLDLIEVDLDPRSLTEDDPQGHYDRFMIVGTTRAGRLLQVICTDQDLPLIRFITAFDVNAFWRRRYEQDNR